jgi:glucokinase
LTTISQQTTQHRQHAQQVVVADIGGTYARLAIASFQSEPRRSPTIELNAFEKILCSDFASLADLLLHYQSLHANALPLDRVIAIAAPIVANDVVAQANLPWLVRHRDLQRYFPAVQTTLLNDFVALAHAVPTIEAHETTLLCGTATEAMAGPVLVIGPGTGFGAAIWLPGSPSQVLASEAGHAALAPTNQKENAILQRLQQRWPHVDNERILSGPGLVNCYQALCELASQVSHLATPAEITQAAMQGQDSIAEQSLSVFCAWLGSVAADLSIVIGAKRVLLAGGIPAQILPFLQRSDFAARFQDKGVMSQVVAAIPVQVIDHGQLALLGATQWYLEKRS